MVVYDWLEKNQASLASIPIVAEHQITLKDFIDKINKESEQQAKETTGATISKEDLKDEVSELTSVGAAALAAHFNKIGDMENETKFEKISFSFINKQRDTQVATAVNPVIEALEANAATLAPIGFLPEDLTLLKNTLSAYISKVGGPRSITLETSGATGSMSTLFADASLFLKKNLDRAIKQLARKNPTAFNQYQSARLIISTGSRSKPAKDSSNTPTP